jgi:hypothetical protein
MTLLDDTCFVISNETINKCRIIHKDNMFKNYLVIAYKQWNLSNITISEKEIDKLYLIQQELLGIEYSQYLFRSNYFIVKNYGFDKEINN